MFFHSSKIISDTHNFPSLLQLAFLDRRLAEYKQVVERLDTEMRLATQSGGVLVDAIKTEEDLVLAVERLEKVR